MDRSVVTQRVWELAEPLALANGLELVDVQFRPEGGRTILRLLLDRPGGGVTLDDLTRVSRELGDVLDAHDAVPGRYHLECSSPGVNRPLLRPAHFERVLGERVRIHTRSALAGRRHFRGTLVEASAEQLVIDDPDAGRVTLALGDVERAHVDHDFSRAAAPRQVHA